MCEVGITLCALNDFVFVRVTLWIGFWVCLCGCNFCLPCLGCNVALDFLAALLGCCQRITAVLHIGVLPNTAVVECGALISINPCATAIDVLIATIDRVATRNGKLPITSYSLAGLHGVLLAVLFITTGNLIGQIHLYAVFLRELCQTCCGLGSGHKRLYDGIGIAHKSIFGILGIANLQSQFLKCLAVILNPLCFCMGR